MLGYVVAFNYNTVDFANTGETPLVCIWLAIINCLTGLASIGTLTVMGIMSYQGIVRNEVAHENRMSRKVEAGVILGKSSALASWNFFLQYTRNFERLHSTPIKIVLPRWNCSENETKILSSCAFDVQFNLLPRVRELFGQRVSIRRDSEMMDAIFPEIVVPFLVRILEIRSERSDCHPNAGLKVFRKINLSLSHCKRTATIEK